MELEVLLGCKRGLETGDGLLRAMPSARSMGMVSLSMSRMMRDHFPWLRWGQYPVWIEVFVTSILDGERGETFLSSIFIGFGDNPRYGLISGMERRGDKWSSSLPGVSEIPRYKTFLCRIRVSSAFITSGIDVV